MKTKTNLLAFGLFLAAHAWLLPGVSAQSVYTPYTFTALAGYAGYGSPDGTGTATRFNGPDGVAADSTGNVYVADSTIRKGFPTSSMPAPILGPPSLGGGPLGFDITGLAGLAVYVESSGDLSNWQVAGTYLLIGGTAHFVSPT